MKKKILVIGGGIGSLAVACRLAARGFNVQIVEKRDRLGGKLSTLEIDGFKFDSGLAAIQAPFMLEDIFAEAGKKFADYIHLIPMDPVYRVFGPGGSVFTKYRDGKLNQQQIERFNPIDKVGYHRFHIRGEQIFKRYFAPLATAPAGLVTSIKSIIQAYRHNEQQPFYDYVASFFRDEFIRQVFSLPPLMIGSSPYTMPAILMMMHSMEKEWGVHYPLGGIGELVAALRRLFEELGGTISLHSEVDEVLFQGRTAAGVRLKDRTIRYADVVVSGVDTAHLYQSLLPEFSLSLLPEWRLDTGQYSASYFILFLGVRRRYLERGLVHHNILIAKGLRASCEEIFYQKKLPENIFLYLNMPTFSDNSIAPPSSELLTILSPVPNLSADIHWEKTARPYRDAILRYLEGTLLPDLRENIVTEHFVAPPYFRDELNAYLGSGHSLQPTLFQSGWFRPHNKAFGLSNLYLVGEGTHPGPGLTGVLLSAKIVADLI